MEKRINLKITEYLDEFKLDIKNWIETNDTIDFNIKSDLLKFVYDHHSLSLEKEDFTKRKRTKSVVPHYLRCMAKRANGEQCTRKRKDETSYCGTHDKNRPHGIISTEQSDVPELKKMEVWLQEINGILYYIDKYMNIYSTPDIVSNKVNPNIIAKYSVDKKNVYSIAIL
tara:strand:+ start:7305 stop:7814 length:510 start_codon:yes stop_codon:yes gene_type:complete